jgi:hypothetical protein
MERLVIKKEELLTVLRQNLTDYKEVFKENLENFKKKYKENLDKFVSDFDKEVYHSSMGVCEIDNNEKDYLDAIRIIELDSRKEISLTEVEYRTLVLNQWHWITEFHSIYVSNSCSSSSSASASLSSTAKRFFNK